MELFKRLERIKQSLMSVLDYSYKHNLAISSGIMCIEILVNEVPDTININTITRDQLIKHYPKLSMYKFRDLTLIDSSFLMNTCDYADGYNRKITYSSTYKTNE